MEYAPLIGLLSADEMVARAMCPNCFVVREASHELWKAAIAVVSCVKGAVRGASGQGASVKGAFRGASGQGTTLFQGFYFS